MKRVTLKGIKRRGISEWKGREWWIKREVRIWSSEHQAWWRAGGHGYTISDEEAGIFNFADAYDHTKHCGPEKRISYYDAGWQI